MGRTELCAARVTRAGESVRWKASLGRRNLQ